MGSLERKFKRNAMKKSHKELGKYLQDARNHGQKTITVQDDEGQVKQVPLPKKPPLGIYIKRTEQTIMKMKQRDQEKRKEAEKNVDLEWKEE